jgi:hypothetical protein
MTIGGPVSFTMTLLLGVGQSEAVFCVLPVNCVVCADQVRYTVNIRKRSNHLKLVSLICEFVKHPSVEYSKVRCSVSQCVPLSMSELYSSRPTQRRSINGSIKLQLNTPKYIQQTQASEIFLVPGT